MAQAYREDVAPSAKHEARDDNVAETGIEIDERWHEINKKYLMRHVDIHLKELDAMTQLFYASTYQDSDVQLEMQTRAIPNILLRENELNVFNLDRVFWDKRNVQALHPVIHTSLPDILSEYLTSEQMQQRTAYLQNQQ